MVLMEDARNPMDYTRITSRIVVGSSPLGVGDIDQLIAETEISAVINMQTESDFAYWQIDWPVLEAYYQQRGIEVRRTPVLDFNPPELRRNLPLCVRTLDELLREGHKVYVHCNVGVNRSPSVVITYLHWFEGLDLDEAIRLVTTLRRCDPYIDSIRGAVEDMAAENS